QEEAEEAPGSRRRLKLELSAANYVSNNVGDQPIRPQIRAGAPGGNGQLALRGPPTAPKNGVITVATSKYGRKYGWRHRERDGQDGAARMRPIDGWRQDRRWTVYASS